MILREKRRDISVVSSRSRLPVKTVGTRTADAGARKPAERQQFIACGKKNFVVWLSFHQRGEIGETIVFLRFLLYGRFGRESATLSRIRVA